MIVCKLIGPCQVNSITSPGADPKQYRYGLGAGMKEEVNRFHSGRRVLDGDQPVRAYRGERNTHNRRRVSSEQSTSS